MNTSSLSFHFLPAVLKILGLSSDQRRKTESDVVGLVVVTAIDKLTNCWSSEEQDKLTQEIEARADKNAGHHDPVILKYLHERFGREKFLEAIQAAAGEIMPEYVKAVLQVASAAQREKIEQVVAQ